MLLSLLLIFAGLFACYGLIIAQAPHLKDEFDKVIPFQGFVGILLILMGFYDLFFLIGTIKLLQINLFFGVLALLTTTTKLILGFVLSYGLVTKYVLTAESDAKENTDKVYNTLIIAQVPFGILAILLGLIGIVVNLIY